MFRQHYPSSDALDIHRYRGSNSFPLKFIRGDKKLDWPIAYRDVFSRLNPAWGLQVLVNWRKANECPIRVREQHKDSYIQSRRRFQIECRSDRSAEGVMGDYAVRQHLIDSF